MATQPKPETAAVADAAPNYHRDVFVDKLHRMLNSLQRVFPDCEATARRALELSVAKRIESVREKIVREWHESMAPFYECAQQRDEHMFREMAAGNKWFRELGIVGKWDDPGFVKSHDIMWRNVQTLNHHARMHCAVPSAMMERVCDMAVSMVNGTKSRNASELLEDGFRLADTMSDAELAKLAREGPAMLGDIVASLTKLNAQDHEGLAQDSFVQVLSERVLASGKLDGLQDMTDEQAEARLADMQRLGADALQMKDALLGGAPK